MKKILFIFLLAPALCSAVDLNSYKEEKKGIDINLINLINGIGDTSQYLKTAGEPVKGGCHNCEKNTPLRPERSKIPIGKNRFNQKCSSFIDSNGDYGPWGKMIVSYIKSNKNVNNRFLTNALPGMESSPQTCPMWGTLTDTEKEKFWVWTMASIAQVESSCDTNSVNTGSSVPYKNDRPRGLFQLNTLKSKRSWRGPNCKFPTGAVHVYKPENSIACSMDIMDELLKGKKGEYKSNGKIFPTNSYWEKLRSSKTRGGPIGKLIRLYPPCKA